MRLNSFLVVVEEIGLGGMDFSSTPLCGFPPEAFLETETTARGHESIFYPGTYCELNYIEYFWVP